LAGYAPQTLKQTFSKDPVLWQLVLPYEILSSKDGGGVDDDVVGLPNPLTMATWQEFMKRNEKNNSFTCIAWLCGFCPLANDGGVVVTYDEKRKQSLSNSAVEDDLVLIRDYYQYLVSHHAFVVTHLQAVLFFKTEPIINQIYQELIERRNACVDESLANKKNLIKRLINLSCGYFGVHSYGSGAGFSIRTKVPCSYQVGRHRIDLNHLTWLGECQLFVMAHSKRSIASTKISHSKAK
jgi:hypothetical protein